MEVRAVAPAEGGERFVLGEQHTSEGPACPSGQRGVLFLPGPDQADRVDQRGVPDDHTDRPLPHLAELFDMLKAKPVSQGHGLVDKH